MVKGGQSRKTKAVGVVSSSHSHISSSFTKKVPTPHSDEEMQSDSDSTQPPTGGSTQHPTSSSTQPPTGDSPQHPTEGSSQPAERRISRRLAKKEVVKDSNGKIIITLSANGLLTPSFEVRACCTDSFQQFVDIEGTTWNNLSKKTTQKYFDELLKYFVRDEKKWSIDIVRKHWNQQARAAYRDFLSGVKKAILKKKKRPIYISKEIEDAWRGPFTMEISVVITQFFCSELDPQSPLK